MNRQRKVRKSKVGDDKRGLGEVLDGWCTLERQIKENISRDRGDLQKVTDGRGPRRARAKGLVSGVSTETTKK